MNTTQSQLMTRIRRKFGGDGAVVTPKDFLDLASRDAVDQALTRLVRKGDLDRVGRGLYHLPRLNPKLNVKVPPDADKVADALGRQTGSQVAPSAAVTANRLGISTQIPAKPIYITSGNSRRVRVGNRTFRLKHVAPHKFPQSDSVVDRALQAIQAAGPDADESVIKTLRRMLSAKERAKLVVRAKTASGWVINISRKVAAPTSVKGTPILG